MLNFDSLAHYKVTLQAARTSEEEIGLEHLKSIEFVRAELVRAEMELQRSSIFLKLVDMPAPFRLALEDVNRYMKEISVDHNARLLSHTMRIEVESSAGNTNKKRREGNCLQLTVDVVDKLLAKHRLDGKWLLDNIGARRKIVMYRTVEALEAKIIELKVKRNQ